MRDKVATDELARQWLWKEFDGCIVEIGDERTQKKLEMQIMYYNPVSG
jgi:hypothetical protein